MITVNSTANHLRAASTRIIQKASAAGHDCDDFNAVRQANTRSENTYDIEFSEKPV